MQRKEVNTTEQKHSTSQTITKLSNEYDELFSIVKYLTDNCKIDDKVSKEILSYKYFKKELKQAFDILMDIDKTLCEFTNDTSSLANNDIIDILITSVMRDRTNNYAEKIRMFLGGLLDLKRSGSFDVYQKPIMELYKKVGAGFKYITSDSNNYDGFDHGARLVNHFGKIILIVQSTKFLSTKEKKKMIDVIFGKLKKIPLYRANKFLFDTEAELSSIKKANYQIEEMNLIIQSSKLLSDKDKKVHTDKIIQVVTNYASSASDVGSVTTYLKESLDILSKANVVDGEHKVNLLDNKHINNILVLKPKDLGNNVKSLANAYKILTENKLDNLWSKLAAELEPESAAEFAESLVYSTNAKKRYCF